MEVVLGVAGGIVVVGGALGLLWRGTRSLAGLVGDVRDFLADWRGEPARPGVPERPGVMERLASIEQRMDGIDRRLVRVEDVVTRVPIPLRGDNGRAVQSVSEVQRVE